MLGSASWFDGYVVGVVEVIEIIVDKVIVVLVEFVVALVEFVVVLVEFVVGPIEIQDETSFSTLQLHLFWIISRVLLIVSVRPAVYVSGASCRS